MIYLQNWLNKGWIKVPKDDDFRKVNINGKQVIEIIFMNHFSNSWNQILKDDVE